MYNIYISNSPQDTEKIAQEFAKELKGGEVIAFTGNLGMGKTCFTRGLAKGLGFKGEVTSPTFALVNEYRGGRLDVFHFDMYRIGGWDDLYSTGYFEYLDEDGVVVIEWSENIASALDNETIYINIEVIGESSRRITVSRGEAFEDTCN